MDYDEMFVGMNASFSAASIRLRKKNAVELFRSQESTLGRFAFYLTASSLLLSCSSSTTTAPLREDSSVVSSTALKGSLDLELIYMSHFGGSRGSSTATIEYKINAKLASESNIAACMEQKGFHYSVPTKEQLMAERKDPPGKTREERVSYGFGISLSLPGKQPPTQDPNNPASQSNEFREALGGKEGCRTLGKTREQKIDSIVQEFTPLVTDLWKRFEADPVVQGSEKSWRECMENQGYMYENKDKIREDVAVKFKALDDSPLKLSELQEFERRLAVADFDCQAAVDAVRNPVMDRLMTDFHEKHKMTIIERLKSVQ
jgi:hypothetical protein